jgi:hypothetical protein
MAAVDAASDSDSESSSWSIDSRAFLAKSGVMIIENGQVTMVASGSMGSLATIENPEQG